MFQMSNLVFKSLEKDEIIFTTYCEGTQFFKYFKNYLIHVN